MILYLIITSEVRDNSDPFPDWRENKVWGLGDSNGDNAIILTEEQYEYLLKNNGKNLTNKKDD